MFSHLLNDDMWAFILSRASFLSKHIMMFYDVEHLYVITSMVLAHQGGYCKVSNCLCRLGNEHFDTTKINFNF